MNMNSPVFSRRAFLSHGAALISAAGTVPLFLDRSGRVLAADFAANPQGAGRPDRVMVIVQLAGGNDGLNTVVPVRNDDYYKARPKLAIARDEALKLTDDLGLHPAAKGFKKLYDDGLMGVVQCVGYPNHNRSHFRSTDIWASTEPGSGDVARDGWGGTSTRAARVRIPGPLRRQSRRDPSAAISLTNSPPETPPGCQVHPDHVQEPPEPVVPRGGRTESAKSTFEKLNDVEMVDPTMDDADHKLPRDPIRNQGVAEPAERPDRLVRAAQARCRRGCTPTRSRPASRR